MPVRIAVVDVPDVTPWGESWGDLAEVVLSDCSAPPVLMLAAFRARHGDDRELRLLVADAVALDEAEREGAV